MDVDKIAKLVKEKLGSNYDKMLQKYPKELQDAYKQRDAVLDEIYKLLGKNDLTLSELGDMVAKNMGKEEKLDKLLKKMG